MSFISVTVLFRSAFQSIEGSLATLILFLLELVIVVGFRDAVGLIPVVVGDRHLVSDTEVDVELFLEFGDGAFLVALEAAALDGETIGGEDTEEERGIEEADDIAGVGTGEFLLLVGMD